MTIESELERARHLAFAADEIAAKELLLSLGEGIEDGDRDDLLLEVFAQLGELYLVRTAYDGVEKCLRRMREIMAVYSAIRAGTRPDADVQGTIANVDIDRMILRYSRRAQFLETGLAAAHGDHESAEVALLVLTDETSAAAFADLADEHAYLVTYARIMCAVALCDDDLHVRSVPLWEKVIDVLDRPDTGSEFDDSLLVLGGTAYGRFCVETGRLPEAEPWLQRAGARAEKRGWELATARTKLERATSFWLERNPVETERLLREAYPRNSRELAGARRVAVFAVLRPDTHVCRWA